MTRRAATVPQQLDPAHEEIVRFLRSAPPQLRSWARGELAALAPQDGTPGPDAAVDLDDDLDDGVRDDVPDDEADGPVDDLADADEDVDDDVDDDEDSGAVARDVRGRPAARGRGTVRRLARSRPVRLAALAAVAVAVVAGVYLSGRPSVPGISGTPTDTASSAAAVDPEKVGALMRRISADPKDVAALSGLGDLYFAAGDYKSAATWEQKVVDLEPSNVTALLALGACEFNQGDPAAAEKAWLRVVALDPKQAEAHYDLGFLYLSADPPDMAKVRAEWNKVVEIDPTSQIAKTVSTHLGSLGPATASPSAPAPASAPASAPAAPSAGASPAR